MRLNSWYLDDGTLVGSPDQLAAALDIIETLAPAIGLNLNRKSLLFIPEEEDATSSPLPTDIPVTRQGFSLLGCLIGPPEFCEEALPQSGLKCQSFPPGRFSTRSDPPPFLPISAKGLTYPPLLSTALPHPSRRRLGLCHEGDP